MRDRMKPLQLGINYGMGVPSLAKGLDRHPLIASTIIERHKRTYPRFWQWREEQVQRAMLERQMETVFGWPLYLSNSPNKRTLYNFPMQGNGAECLRLAATRLCEAGIVPSMLMHDAVLLEVRDREQIAQAIEIMKAASRDVCDGFEIGVGVDQMLENGARYQDKRPVAKAMWATIMRVLADVRRFPKSKTMGKTQYVYSPALGKRIAVESDTTQVAARKRKRKPFKVEWFKYPTWWIEALRKASAGAHLLAPIILAEAFKREYIGGDIVLSSELTKMPPTTRKTGGKGIGRAWPDRRRAERQPGAHRHHRLLPQAENERVAI